VTPAIAGIVNVTEDSFSDGGRYLDPERALAQARRLVADGAEAIDLGPASSRPEATPVAAAEEIRRLTPLVDVLIGEGIRVAVDSWRIETQRFALARPVAYLNDIRGFPDPALYPELAAHACRLVVMHQIGEHATREPLAPAAVLASIHRFFDARLEALERAGVARERLIVDPGMGFFLGGDPEASWAVLRAIPELKRRWRLPLYVCVSRKAFLGRLTGRRLDAVGPATLSAELYAAAEGVDFIRTHDVRALRDALLVQDTIRGV
jgi:dihydropteroate synthase type 2